ncbi:hypothetical protein F8388_024993 [Cannabis sativa]|uniref:non-specific serine/threonine protein kinase n=1 Tax=Cannabis sativa TaxID=3483 RepID=A0A7J6G3Y0_CANSA|nr:hypothetical protein F8388_024993 [Cannabis sativa]
MFPKLPIFLLLVSTLVPLPQALSQAQPNNLSFVFNGFKSGDLVLDGIAEITSNGLLKLTNDTTQKAGHAFFPNPVTFKATPNGTVSSFSTTFVFAIRKPYPDLSGHGIVFVIAPTRGLPGALPSQYLGLFNESNNGNATNRVVGVELDTIQSTEFNDINANHVGIDINDLASVKSEPASYFDERKGGFTNLSLISGKSMRVWVDYDGVKKQMNVTLAPSEGLKPQKPLLSLTEDLSPFMKDTMYIGFSSSTGSIISNHYVLGWSFKINGQAQELDLSKLPKLPRVGPKPKSKLMTIGLPVMLTSLVALVILSLVHFIKRKRKFAELIEDWESEYGPHRYKYKDLYMATKGFKDKGLLGAGGFGSVYKGVLPSKTEIAVKRVSHESRQGMREFVAEIASLGRLRHRNVVQLLGYCRRKEVACGRRPIEGSRTETGEELILVDWVFSCWCRGNIMEAMDSNLIELDSTEAGLVLEEEVELVLKLGLLCSHSEPRMRPTMRQVVSFLERDAPLPDLSTTGLTAAGLTFGQKEGFDDFAMSYPSSMAFHSHVSTASVAESLLSSGR